MEELRVRTAGDEGFPPLLFVHLGTVSAGDAFFARRWPEARAVSDPGKRLYASFGLARGSLRQVMGPAVWMPGLRALLSGHGVGRPAGDTLQMCGHFLVRDGAIVWQHVHEHSADALRGDEIRAAAAPR